MRDTIFIPHRGRFDPRIQASPTLKLLSISLALLTLNPGTSMFLIARLDASNNHASQDFI